jgi:acyl-CoA synthetase (AMP-forming)/AMP-acid ligase II
VVLRGGEEIDGEALREFVGQRLAAYNVPRTISFAQQLPLSPVGKVLRRVVREACRQNFETN